MSKEMGKQEGWLDLDRSPEGCPSMNCGCSDIQLRFASGDGGRVQFYCASCYLAGPAGADAESALVLWNRMPRGSGVSGRRGASDVFAYH